MENRIAKLIELVKKLPENSLEEAIVYIEGKIEESSDEKPKPPCPHCKSEAVKQYGKAANRQRYYCKGCKRTFMETTNTIMAHSPCGEAVWKQVIRDTVEGESLDKTAESLDMTHATAFHMRHKILLALETQEHHRPTVLSGVCELDDTYVLESYKGKKMPKGFWRKARNHGAVAQKRGISNEYLCISTGVQRDGAAYSRTVTRATPSKDDITTVFQRFPKQRKSC